jgi:hypothetical protein
VGRFAFRNDRISGFSNISRRSVPWALREQVARALVNKGVTLGRLRHLAEANAVYDALSARATEPALREQVARALVVEGVRLADQLNRPDEAIAVYDALIARFEDATEPAGTARASHHGARQQFGQFLVRANDIAGAELSINCRTQNVDAVERGCFGNLRFFARKDKLLVADFRSMCLLILYLSRTAPTAKPILASPRRVPRSTRSRIGCNLASVARSRAPRLRARSSASSGLRQTMSRSSG